MIDASHCKAPLHATGTDLKWCVTQRQTQNKAEIMQATIAKNHHDDELAIALMADTAAVPICILVSFGRKTGGTLIATISLTHIHPLRLRDFSQSRRGDAYRTVNRTGGRQNFIILPQ